MDAFIISTPQKKEKGSTLHGAEIERLKQYVAEGKNVFVCGATGSGKTFVVDSVLNAIELHAEMLMKKNMYKDTQSYKLIDGYDTSIHVFKQFVEDEHVKRLIVTSTDVHILPHFELIVMPRRDPEAIATLAPDSLSAAIKCNGNIRNFFDYLTHSDTKDVFKTSKEIVTDILCTPGPFDLSQTVHEHGHVCDVIHGNYLSSKDGRHTDIIESLSVADVYDTLMYKGDWGYMPYYIATGIATPKLHLGAALDPETIRPGSTWTKYGNFKMRQQKLKHIQKQHSTRLGIEELAVIRLHATQGNVEPAVSYGLQPSDFDVMNHLALCNKLKPSEVVRIKKKLRNVYNEL